MRRNEAIIEAAQEKLRDLIKEYVEELFLDFDEDLYEISFEEEAQIDEIAQDIFETWKDEIREAAEDVFKSRRDSAREIIYSGFAHYPFCHDTATEEAESL